MKTYKWIIGFLYCILTYFVFRPIFLLQPIAGGDYFIRFPENFIELQKIPFIGWDGTINLGWNIIFLLHYGYYNFLIAFFYSIYPYAWVVERITWWLPYFILSTLSIISLYKYIFPKSTLQLLSPLIFCFNTYILMIIGGGQIAGIGLAYAIAPFVLLVFFKLFDHMNFTNALCGGILLSLQILFDPREAFITMFAVLFLALFYSPRLLKNLLYGGKFVFFVFVIPILIAAFIHIYWIIPLLLARGNPLGELGAAYITGNAVRYFSFATFENTIGLLHPNWPENIFGKIGFMKQEFLFLPILAFSSLLFIKRQKEKIYLLFFALIGLLGIFLSKGSNDPFGGLYLWMFDHVPGFVLFRDPTKWYLLIGISYSVLIPYSIGALIAHVRSIRILKYIILVLIVSYLLFLIRPALFGQLTAVLKPHTIPKEYIQLETFLTHDKKFSRTFWVPSIQRFAFYTSSHPAIVGRDFFHVSSISALMHQLNRSDAERVLQNASVLYVIIPYDSEGEIFTKDRVYANTLYTSTVTQMRKISYLSEVPGFGRLHVFRIAHAKDHFWIGDANTIVSYRTISPVFYTVFLKNARKGDMLIFSEAYNPYWQANVQSNNEIILSKSYKGLLNSFLLPKSGTYAINIFYTPQKFIDIGLIISICSFTILIVYLAYSILYKKNK